MNLEYLGEAKEKAHAVYDVIICFAQHSDPDILAKTRAVILIYGNSVLHFASHTNIYREFNEWMKRNSCDSFHLIAHFISSSSSVWPYL